MSSKSAHILVLISLITSLHTLTADSNAPAPSLANERLRFKKGLVKGSVQMKIKPESFCLKNANLLNATNLNDFIALNRSTIDYNLALQYGEDYYGYNPLEFFTSMRNKSVWGNPESIAQTTNSKIKSLEVVFGDHNHFLARHVMWIREMWMDFSVTDAFCLDTANTHRFRLGAFPFELGRGIALGAAFAVGPRVLGFYSDNAIDQYAFGFKLAGNLIRKDTTYDLYVAILENKSDSFSNTGAKILGQEYGHRLDQARGAGVIDFIAASRFKWIPINSRGKLIAFEPYALYNYAPEQRIEFLGDSNSKLATIGLAGEFEARNAEWGFDMAFNFGSQRVKGWDRNETSFANNAGTVTIVNTQVHQNSPTGPRVLYVPGSAQQTLINTSIEDASQNGQPIGTVDGVTLYNSINRFNNPYYNKFNGWMIVADAIYNFNREKTFRVAATFGYSTGDRNPNQDFEHPNDSSIDGTFHGFIGLQELYSGSRVQSVFLLGGTGKVPRPLSLSVAQTVNDRTPAVIAGFTNLAFVGEAIHWYPKIGPRSLNLRTNALSYWQTSATHAFNPATGTSYPDRFANNYLGTEVNIFADVDMLKDFDTFKLFVVSSVFIPGAHFRDLRGMPLTRDDIKLLEQNDVTGILNDRNPFLSDDLAYTLNIGIELRF